MAETKQEKTIEREYIVPLRKEWLKVQSYRRAARAAKAIKKFIARHMRVEDRDLDKVKLDVYLNSELWANGVRCPPSKIKVKAIKEGEIVRVTLAEIPEIIKFRKARHLKIHTKAEVKKEEKKEEKQEVVKEEKPEEKKVEEVEKEKAVEEKQIKESKAKEKAEKHIAKTKEVQFARRSMSRH